MTAKELTQFFVHIKRLLPSSPLEFVADKNESLNVYPFEWPESPAQNSARTQAHRLADENFDGIVFEEKLIASIAEPTDDFINMLNITFIKSWVRGDAGPQNRANESIAPTQSRKKLSEKNISKTERGKENLNIFQNFQVQSDY